MPWRIQAVGLPTLTFRGFYHEQASKLIEDARSRPRELHSTFVGKSKDSTDVVDSELPVREVVAVFGPFAKFIVEEIGVELEPQVVGESFVIVIKLGGVYTTNHATSVLFNVECARECV